MSVVDKALDNVRDHGVDVERPDTVRSHSEVNSESELLSTFGISEGLEAASYNSLSNRMDLYKPLATTRVIEGLDDDEMEQVMDAFERNKGSFIGELMGIGVMGDFDSSDAAKASKLQYKAALMDDQVDDELQEHLRDSLEEELLHDSEHELVHAAHYQDVLDGDIEPIEDGFRRYMRDVRNINEDMDQYDERKMQEGVSDLNDVEMAAAMNFVDDDRLQNIVGLAGKEHKKWDEEFEKAERKYRSRLSQLTEEAKESMSPEGWTAFDELTNLVQLNIGGLDRFDSIDHAVEAMEEDGVDEYEEVVEAGYSKRQLKDTLKEINEIEQEWDQTREQPSEYRNQVGELLEQAVLREAELQGDFDSYMEQYEERFEQSEAVPTEFTEAFAQFWTAYRRGDLEGNRDEVYERLEGYDVEGLDETMDDIFRMYDEADGDQEERVTEVMSSQMEYLEKNYDIEA